jgi:glycosyltransferase involved in cell wall biosynthesis
MSKISVIIPVWNEARSIERLLRYLLATGCCAEIIVADGQGDDGTVGVVEKYAYCAHHLDQTRTRRPDERRGP